MGFDTCPRETGSVPKTKFQSSRVGISRLFRPVRLEDWNLWGADFLSSSLLEESKVSESGRTVEVFGFGGFLSLLRVFHWGMFPFGFKLNISWVNCLEVVCHGRFFRWDFELKLDTGLTWNLKDSFCVGEDEPYKIYKWHFWPLKR